MLLFAAPDTRIIAAVRPARMRAACRFISSLVARSVKAVCALRSIGRSFGPPCSRDTACTIAVAAATSVADGASFVLSCEYDGRTTRGSEEYVCRRCWSQLRVDPGPRPPICGDTGRDKGRVSGGRGRCGCMLSTTHFLFTKSSMPIDQRIIASSLEGRQAPLFRESFTWYLYLQGTSTNIMNRPTSYRRSLYVQISYTCT